MYLGMKSAVMLLLSMGMEVECGGEMKMVIEEEYYKYCGVKKAWLRRSRLMEDSIVKEEEEEASLDLRICREEKNGEGEGKMKMTSEKEEEAGKGKGKGKKVTKQKNESRDALKKARVEALERVIEVNKRALDELMEKHKADLEGRTGCRIGSLEWIDNVKETLRRVAEKMDQREIRELLENAVERYREELKEKTAAIKNALHKWIPRYKKALKAFYRKRETVAQLFRNGKWNDNVHRMAKRARIHAQSYKMIAKILQQGLGDVAKGQDIQDLRNDCGARKSLGEIRTFRSDRNTEAEQNAHKGVEHHIKNTIFYPVMAALSSDYHRRDNHKYKKTKKSFAPVYEKLADCLESLGDLKKKVESLEELRNKKVTMRKEEVKVLGSVCGYLEGYVKKVRVLAGQDFRVLYMEGVEAYVMEQERRGGGRLERVMRALYRITVEIGHLENVMRKRRGEEVKGYLSTNYKNRIMAKWVKAVRSEVP